MLLQMRWIIASVSVSVVGIVLTAVGIQSTLSAQRLALYVCFSAAIVALLLIVLQVLYCRQSLAVAVYVFSPAPQLRTSHQPLL